MYLTAVGVAGVFGYVLGVVVYGNGGPAGPLAGGSSPQYGSIGPIAFELTPVNLAAFGVVMVGLILGIGLAAIVYVSNRADAS